MTIALVTGSAGLVGSEAVKFLSAKGLSVIGIDNNLRKYFFGEDGSTEQNRKNLETKISGYLHYGMDIRDEVAVENLFKKYGSEIKLIIHTAGQPSHDWAAKEPFTDFSVNATGTLILLEMMRKYTPKAVFIFSSTNKVYGDKPNELPLTEKEMRWELDPSHIYAKFGIDETMSIDQSRHSLFGVSKTAGDLLVQEYGKYFHLKTACFRAGCITGPAHAGAKLHGFLAYLVKCNMTGEPYTVIGYKGKQVRDNIHSFDIVNAFWHFYQNPREGEVYNIGGSRHSNCSVLEAIQMSEKIGGRKLNWKYADDARIGDHIWWISDIRKFQSHYPEWTYRYNLQSILNEIHEVFKVRTAS